MSQSLFSSIILKPKKKSCCVFVKRTRVIVTSRLTCINTSSLECSVEQEKESCYRSLLKWPIQSNFTGVFEKQALFLLSLQRVQALWDGTSSSRKPSCHSELNVYMFTVGIILFTLTFPQLGRQASFERREMEDRRD